MDFFLAALSGGGVTVILLGIVAHLGRSQLAHWLNKDLERERSRLAAELEKVKADLGKLNAEHSVRFTSLHAKRAEVVAKLYSLLVKASWAAESFLSPIEMGGEPSKREKYVVAHNAIARVFRYLGRHRIYLPESIAESLQKMLADMRSPVIGFGVYVRLDDHMINSSAEKLDAWSKGWRQLTDEIPSARALLEKELRQLLGEAPEHDAAASRP